MPCSVHITTVHPPFDVRIFYKEAKTLAAAGFDVILIAQHDKNEVVDGIKIIPLPKAKNRIHRMLKITSKAFWIALKQKAAVYHLHDPELLPMAVLLKLFKGKKVIYDVHEDYGKQMLSKPYLPKIGRKGVAFFERIIECFSSKLFDAVITATDDILKNFSHHRRAVSLKNFPEISNFPVVREKEGIDHGVFRLIYVGILAEIRGIRQIIQALSYIHSNNQLKLTLCGKFDSVHYEFDVKNIKGYEKVEYLGWIEPPNIPKLLGKYDVGIVCLHPISNYITALPLKLFEYMAAGLPVIASNFPLWKRIVEESGCGICVDPLKPEEIARAITYLLNHHDLRKEMGENGRKAVSEKFNWEQESRKLIEIYEGLLR